MLRLTINSDQLIRGIADHEKAAALKDLADLRRHTSPPQPPEARSLTSEATPWDELRCGVSCRFSRVFGEQVPRPSAAPRPLTYS